jgi:hypothetical protein
MDKKYNFKSNRLFEIEFLKKLQYENAKKKKKSGFQIAGKDIYIFLKHN